MFLTQKQRLDLKATTKSGGDGQHTMTNIWEAPIQVLSEIQQTTPDWLVEPSLNCTEDRILQSQELLLDIVQFQWQALLSERPSAHWVRRCGTVSGHAPFTVVTAPIMNTPSTSENI